jgi:hypothetical protein
VGLHIVLCLTLPPPLPSWSKFIIDWDQVNGEAKKSVLLYAFGYSETGHSIIANQFTAMCEYPILPECHDTTSFKMWRRGICYTSHTSLKYPFRILHIRLGRLNPLIRRKTRNERMKYVGAPWQQLQYRLDVCWATDGSHVEMKHREQRDRHHYFKSQFILSFCHTVFNEYL